VHKPILGVIGGIGSGKSLVAAELARRGGYIIAADQLGHEALRQPEIMARVRERWGAKVVNAQGDVDRRRLGGIVFADASERRELETMVFPWIERRIEEEIAKADADPKVAFVILDAAIMVEAGWDRRCDYVVFVDAPQHQRLERLARQRRLSLADVEVRERAQMPLEEKKRLADFVIDNSGTPEHMARQLERVVKHLLPGKG
jgi:dephospho-CoA kinase